MNDQVGYSIPEEGPEEGHPAAEETGNEAADEVVRSLDGLEARPVEEHVAVFERAHERLRAALAGGSAPDDRPDDRPGGQVRR